MKEPIRELIKTLISLFILTLMFTGCANFKNNGTKRHAPSKQDSVIEPLGEFNYFGSLKVKKFKLKNGLKILILEDHSSPTFSYQTWFNVGSRDETEGLTGLAHLFEHMMFKATKNNPEGTYDRTLERAGAEGLNAFTDRDMTAYVLSLPSDKLDLIAGLEADRMVNLIVDEKALDKEREVVQNERRFRNENSPDGKMWEWLYKLAYKKSSYRWPVIGYEEDLKRAKSAQCYDFYKRYYAPNNATLVIVGDVNANDAMKIIEKHYGSLKESDIKRTLHPSEPVQLQKRYESHIIKSEVPKLVIGYHVTDVQSSDLAAISVLNQVLAGGKSSRLHRKLVDTGLASGVSSDNSEHKDPGLFTIYVNLQKNKQPNEVIKILDKELDDIKRGNASALEIEKAVAMYRFSIFDNQASNSSKAEFLGFYETIAGRFERGIELIEGLKSVRSEQLANVAKTYFNKENRSTVFGVAKK